ncbi:sulfatase-like hydrolase/transferase [Thalassotalea fonticola]|uniref:Sulfatase-like hydrolase/transferase n=1 Tax=Thalassotalea fonticola TaxID=3065649 RepID=A0ABZ0GVI7_9GAMM|nr:sulfatase-like hydrolase/transferase [Colwelliaceae bacterium S1-1]
MFKERNLLTLAMNVLGLVMAVTIAPVRAESKPNIIVIMSDDAGYADIGFSGNIFGKANFATPNIDKLADSGVKFTQAYVTASVCSPSRAGMLTGRYQQRFGHEYNLPVTPEPGDTAEYSGMLVGEKTIADHLKASGYRTGLIGKWHLGLEPQFHPNKRGFDEFYGLLGGGRSYWENDKQNTDYRRIYRNQNAENYQGYLTDKLGDEAIDFIRRNQEQPFFLYLSYTAVHAPMEAKPEHEELLSHIKDKNRRTLAGMTLALDESVGEVMNALDEFALTENTLVVFLNDNGGPSDYNFSINKPFSGVKGTLYEGGVRVPFAMSWPGKIKANSEYKKMISSLDILPTALAAAGADLVGKNPIDGVDLLPFLSEKNSEQPHQTLFWRRSAFAAVRDNDYKLVRYPDRPAVLYDLSNDLAEEHNLAGSKPELVRSLMKKLFAWENELKAPVFLTHSKWIKQNRERYSIFTSVDKQ